MLSLTGSHFIESACSADTVSMYSIETCMWAGKSPYCDIVIAKSPVYGKVLFLDNEIQSAELDEAIYHEHLVHPILNAQAHIPRKKILIVGGGEAATAREALKWSEESVAEVYWVDIDGALVELCRRHLGWADDAVYNNPRLHFYAQDIRSFLAQCEIQFDVIVLDLPDPDVDALLESDPDEANYSLYGRRFFQILKEHLTEQGAIVSHTGPISPGGDSMARRPGLTWIQNKAREQSLGSGHAYHVTIPSFQGEWGFWMSVQPSTTAHFPQDLRVMDALAQHVAFTWPAYWNSPRLGSSSGS